jgi:hypothetical protein
MAGTDRGGVPPLQPRHHTLAIMNLCMGASNHHAQDDVADVRDESRQ